MFLGYTGEMIDLSDCDRVVAIMIVDGRMYLSDCDHQDCLAMYCKEHGIACGVDFNDENFDEIQKQLIHVTNGLFDNEKICIYGFDVFEGYDDVYYLTSHFPSNMEKCYGMMSEYAKEHGYVMGTFCGLGYKVKLIKPMEESNHFGNKIGICLDDNKSKSAVQQYLDYQFSNI